MSGRPRLRKFALTAHVVSSVGWLGAVVVFLALSVVGLTSRTLRWYGLPTSRWSRSAGSFSYH